MPAIGRAEAALRLRPANRGTAGVVAGLVLLQAVVTDHALFGDWPIRVRGWNGTASFALGARLIWSTWRARAVAVAVGTAAAPVRRSLGAARG
jgi:hypothetical protein